MVSQQITPETVGPLIRLDALKPATSRAPMLNFLIDSGVEAGKRFLGQLLHIILLRTAGLRDVSNGKSPMAPRHDRYYTAP